MLCYTTPCRDFCQSPLTEGQRSWRTAVCNSSMKMNAAN